MRIKATRASKIAINYQRMMFDEAAILRAGSRKDKVVCTRCGQAVDDVMKHLKKCKGEKKPAGVHSHETSPERGPYVAAGKKRGRPSGGQISGLKAEKKQKK